MLLEVSGLTKRFGGLVAVSDVSFGIDQGEIVGIFGPNGSGKTTTLNLIAGMLPPTSGQLAWKGISYNGQKPFAIAARGIVKTFQNPQLFPELTVAEHMRIACHLRQKRALGGRRYRGLIGLGVPDDAGTARRIDAVLELCRLAALRDEEASALSYGAEKMLGVAMAVMCEPELLLLDEPASGLGGTEVANLDAVLRDLRAEGLTLGIIDHKVSFLGRLADRAIALHHGAVIAMGRTADVLADDAVIDAYLGRSHA